MEKPKGMPTMWVVARITTYNSLAWNGALTEKIEIVGETRAVTRERAIANVTFNMYGKSSKGDFVDTGCDTCISIDYKAMSPLEFLNYKRTGEIEKI